ncbi:YheC/YheD family protein [Paenibacillus agilis]|uniref:YheC/YheD family protein n=1 Tax=Paenibacillus agilis TaxID=3020863 RepID=A0A559IHL8_9BACL|nr:YheC/YheD family protein [Paenibacillus agilis]TVX87172.1 YheC/YheD family protein [Paenibacillus agilis]
MSNSSMYKRIGILFNDRMLRGVAVGKTGQEKLAWYEEAASRHEVIPVYFRLEDVDMHSMQVKAYMRQGKRYVSRKIALPRVIHNRAIYTNPRYDRKIQTIIDRGYILYNQVNRYGKMTIHEILRKDPYLYPFLPETEIASEETIHTLMKRHQSLIIKPNNSSVGKGIMKMERTSRGWQAIYPTTPRLGKQRWQQQRTTGEVIPQVILNRIRKAKSTYLVQQTLPLSKYAGRPFDLRVSVQKCSDRNWKITGVVGKVAPTTTFVTNVAQGGAVVPFEQLVGASLPNFTAEVLLNRVSNFSLHIAHVLANILPNVADFGLDIGISPDGCPLFIECNGRDQRYSFKEAKLLQLWKATYENPIAYGASLLQPPSSSS